MTVVVGKDGFPTSVSRGWTSEDRALGPNEYPVDTVFPDVPYQYWKKVNGVWHAMTEEDIKAKAAKELAAINAKKSLEQKVYENEYFKLSKTVLAMLDDPRKDAAETPKLSALELQAAYDQLSVVDFQASVALALRFLALDVALKRFDVLWWDNVSWHPEVEK
jgi:hypothetical protein